MLLIILRINSQIFLVRGLNISEESLGKLAAPMRVLLNTNHQTVRTEDIEDAEKRWRKKNKKKRIKKIKRR